MGGRSSVPSGSLNFAPHPPESGSEFVSSLSDRVEAEVARAKRTFRQSRSIIAAARSELESYGRWLDRQRVTSADECKSLRQLSSRKMAVEAVTRFAVAPFELAQALRLRLTEGLSRTSSPLSFAETASHFVVFAVGFITIFLVAGGASRATRSSPPAKASVLAAPKVPDPRQGGEASVTVPKTPARAKTSVAGLSHPTAPAFDALLLPAHTVAEMMLITSPLALAPKGPEKAAARIAEEPFAPKSAVKAKTATAPIAEEPLVRRPAVRAKPKRKLLGPEPQQFPWWQRWSWIRVR
jgi:hypothetical protein